MLEDLAGYDDDDEENIEEDSDIDAQDLGIIEREEEDEEQ
jgi:hypothetical protein